MASGGAVSGCNKKLPPLWGAIFIRGGGGVCSGLTAQIFFVRLSMAQEGEAKHDY